MIELRAYSDAYLNDVVENQGKLFDFISQKYPQKDTCELPLGQRIFQLPIYRACRFQT